MRVAVVGAGGMLGRELLKSLPDGHTVTEMLLVDMFAAERPPISELKVKILVGDLQDSAIVSQIATWKPDVVFHLAAMMSSAAEADFAGGYALNLTAFMGLLEAIRRAGNCPRFIFASSLAVYGAPYPARTDERLALRPMSSYGTQKALAELLLVDYNRKRFVEGISLRLPTLVVRPGRPNQAASSFLSSILREPLAGESANLPVPRDTKVWIASPGKAAAAFWHAAALDSSKIQGKSPVNLRGLSVSVADMIETAKAHAPHDLEALITEVPDLSVTAIVTSWPWEFECALSDKLGFPFDASLDTLVGDYVAAGLKRGTAAMAKD